MARGVVRYSLFYRFIGEDKKATSTAKDVAAAIDSTGKAANRAARPIQKNAQGLQALAGAYNAMIVAKRGIGLIAAGIKPAMAMQSATAKLSIATGLQGASLNRLTAAARASAEITPFGPPEALDAARKLQLATGDVGTAIELLTPTLSLATVYFEKDFGKATQLVSQIVAGFGMSGKEAAKGIDHMVGAAVAAGVPMEDMEKGLKKLGIISAVSGQSFEQLMPTYALAARVFKDSASGSTGFLTGLLNLGNAKKRDRLETALGIDITNKATGHIKSLSEVITILAKKQRDYSGNVGEFETRLERALDKRALKPFIAAMSAVNMGIRDMDGNVRKGADAFTYLNKSMYDYEGKLKKNTEELMKTFAGRVELLQEGWGNLLTVVFMPLLHILAPIAAGITHVVNKMRELAESQNPIIQTFMAFVRAGMWVAGIIATVVAGQLALKAVTMIAGAAFGFLGLKLFGAMSWLRFGMIDIKFMVLFLGYLTKGAFAGATAMGLLTKAWRGFGLAIKGLVSTLGGWITLVMILLEVGGYLYKLFKQSTTAALNKPDKKLKDDSTQKLLDARMAYAKALVEQSRSNRALSMNTQHLDRVVNNWGRIIDKQTPMLSRPALSKVTGSVRAGIAGGKAQAGAEGALESRMQLLDAIFNKGGALNATRLKQAHEAIAVLGQTMRTMGYNGETTEKAIKGLEKGLRDLSFNSDSLGVTFWQTSARAKGALADINSQRAAAAAEMQRLRAQFQYQVVDQVGWPLAKGKVATSVQMARSIPMGKENAKDKAILRQYTLQEEIFKNMTEFAAKAKSLMERGARGDFGPTSKALSEEDKKTQRVRKEQEGLLPTSFADRSAAKQEVYLKQIADNTKKSDDKLYNLARKSGVPDLLSKKIPVVGTSEGAKGLKPGFDSLGYSISG
jgi:TP901 family phage tail tape measure protein